MTRERDLPDVPAGPLDAEPAIYLSHADGADLLTDLLTTAGVELGAYDQQIVGWLAGWEGSTVLTVASWIRRAAEGGRR